MRHFIFMFLLLSLLTGCQTPIPKDSKLGREIAKLENTYKTRKERLNRVKKELNNAQNTHKSTQSRLQSLKKKQETLLAVQARLQGQIRSSSQKVISIQQTLLMSRENLHKSRCAALKEAQVSKAKRFEAALSQVRAKAFFCKAKKAEREVSGQLLGTFAAVLTGGSSIALGMAGRFIGGRGSCPTPPNPNQIAQRTKEILRTPNRCKMYQSLGLNKYGSWAYNRRYAVIFYGSREVHEANAFKSRLSEHGLKTHVVLSTLYSSLKPGWFIVVGFPTRSRTRAKMYKTLVKETLKDTDIRGIYYRYLGSFRGQ